MPAAPADRTLGFIGMGEVPDRMLELELDNVLASVRGTAEFVLAFKEQEPNPSMMTLVSLVRDRPERKEVLTQRPDWATAGVYSYASSLVNAVDLPTSLVNRLERAANPLLLVFWDEGPDTRRAVAAALDRSIEVRDLCDALTRLGDLPTDKETTAVPTEIYIKGETKEEIEAELNALDQSQLQELAEEKGIDHEAIPTWEEVASQLAEIIVNEPPEGETAESQDAAGAGEAEREAKEEVAHISNPMTAIEDPAGEFYTRAELERYNIDQVKEICRRNGILDRVPGTRPRIPRYIDAIMEYQDELRAMDQGLAPADGDEPVAAPSEAAPTADEASAMVIQLAADELVEELRSLFVPVVALLEGVSTELGEISAKLDKLASAPTPPPVKAVATKAVAAKKATIVRG
jgi:hypothetical protein